MKTQRMWWMAGASLLMVAGPIWAQVAPQPAPRPAQAALLRVTFAEAIQIALKQNLTVRQMENNLVAQQATANQARSNLLPDLSFRTSANDNVGQQFNLNTGKLTTQQTRSLSPTVISSFLVYDASRTTSNIRSARETANAMTMDVARTRQTAVFTVASDFVSLVSAQSQLDVQRENLTALQVQLDQIQQFANAGARPISDLYQQRASVASAQLSVTQADQSVEIAKINLIQALQLDPAKEYEFVAPPIPDVATARTFSLDSLVAIAYAKRPDIAAERARVAASAQDLRSARAGRMPNMSANVNYATAQQVAAQQALDAVQQRYNVGAATLLEITQARSQLVNAQSSLSTAKYNLVLTQAVLSYYTGELDPNNIRLGIGG